MPQFRKSAAQKPIVIRRPIDTLTTIEAYGSGDDFTTPFDEFGTDETIMITGTVTATDNANLIGVLLTVLLDGVDIGTTPLYGYDGIANFYQLNLGVLLEGTHTVEVQFPRTRI